MFTVYRGKITTPTPLIFKRQTKLISLGHLFRVPKGASYENDDAQYFLSLKDTKKKSSDEKNSKMREICDSLDDLLGEDEVMKEATEDQEFFLQNPMLKDARGFTNAAILGYAGQYFLRGVLMKRSKCDKCLTFFTTKDVTDEKVCNTLVRFKEFKEGSMVRLNKMGDWFVRVTEGLFQLYR